MSDVGGVGDIGDATGKCAAIHLSRTGSASSRGDSARIMELAGYVRSIGRQCRTGCALLAHEDAEEEVITEVQV